MNKIEWSFCEDKKEIEKALHIYIETINYENAYFNEKYYLNGLKDGIKLM